MPGEEAVIEFDTSKAGPGYMQSEILTQYGEVKSVAEHTDKRLLNFFFSNQCRNTFLLYHLENPLMGVFSSFFPLVPMQE